MPPTATDCLHLPESLTIRTPTRPLSQRRLNPKYVHAMNNLGNILKERNELQEAEELLSLAVQIQ